MTASCRETLLSSDPRTDVPDGLVAAALQGVEHPTQLPSVERHELHQDVEVRPRKRAEQALADPGRLTLPEQEPPLVKFVLLAEQRRDLGFERFTGLPEYGGSSVVVDGH